MTNPQPNGGAPASGTGRRVVVTGIGLITA